MRHVAIDIRSGLSITDSVRSVDPSFVRRLISGRERERVQRQSEGVSPLTTALTITFFAWHSSKEYHFRVGGPSDYKSVPGPIHGGQRPIIRKPIKGKRRRSKLVQKINEWTGSEVIRRPHCTSPHSNYFSDNSV